MAEGGNFIKIVIGIAIALALVPVVISSVNAVTPNLSGGALILIGLTSFLFVAGIITYISSRLIK